MLARRIIAVSPDKAFGKQLATALKAAGGAVDGHQAPGELGKGDLQASLVVLHLDGELPGAAADIIPRLTGESRVIAILPRSNLAAVVDVMLSSERVSGIMVAEDFDGRELSAMATRVLAGDIFGIEKVLHWGTLVHSQLVGDYQDKSLCISQISEFAELLGVRRKYRESIEQCVDEMLMNALYDAPIDDQGKPIFSEIPTKTRIALRVEQKVVVQYACDGTQFVVSVRDAFGTLERGTALRYLHKCLHAEQQIDRKIGGAGLGLYLMVNSATTVYFNVLPGVATEAVCVFDLETPKLQLAQFGFFTEKIDAAGRLATGPSRRLPTGHPVERRHEPAPPARPRGVVAALAIAIAAMIGLIGVTAWPRLVGGNHLTQVTFTTSPEGARIEIEGHNAGTAPLPVDLEIGRAYPVVARLDGYAPKEEVVEPHDGKHQVAFELTALAATVDLDSQPSGAKVEIDGKPVGATPVSVTTLRPETAVTIAFKKPGFHDATLRLDVPSPGKAVRVVQPLAVSEELARITLTSEPPGAQVVQNGQLLAGITTPAEVLVEAGKLQRFVLTMPRHVPAVIDPFTPARGFEGTTKTGRLEGGVTVKVEATLDGRVTISGAPHCRDLATPAECVLAPGGYLVDFTGPARLTHPVTVAGKDLIVRFELGYVEAAPGKLTQLGTGAGVRRAVLEAGPRTITVSDDAGTHPTTVGVKAGATVIAN